MSNTKKLLSFRESSGGTFCRFEEPIPFKSRHKFSVAPAARIVFPLLVVLVVMCFGIPAIKNNVTLFNIVLSRVITVRQQTCEEMVLSDR